jgi:glycosyltransferase involved in cell wall biosynthesis
MPKVSVIIPNYNHAPYLRQRIDTVLGQTFQDFEVILMDDCSTDDSRTIISEYANDPRIRIELNENNSGSTFKQWKKGIALARGEYIWMAESDDYSDERFLERLVGVLESQPDVTIVYCRSWIIKEDGRRDRLADCYLADLDPRRWNADFLADGREECRCYFVANNSIPNASSAVFRKAIYERIGGVDDRLRVCGDWKLWVSIALEGKVAYLAEPLNYYREHDATVRVKGERTGLIAAEHMAIVRWMLERVAPPEAVKEKILRSTPDYWIPAVLTLRVPFATRASILRDAMAIDPHALRRLVRPALTAVRMKLALEFRSLRQRFEGRAS